MDILKTFYILLVIIFFFYGTAPVGAAFSRTRDLNFYQSHPAVHFYYPQQSSYTQLSQLSDRIISQIHRGNNGQGFDFGNLNLETIDNKTHNLKLDLNSHQSPIYFILDYQNPQNYKTFYCQDWQCYFQQQRHGRPLYNPPPSYDLSEFAQIYNPQFPYQNIIIHENHFEVSFRVHYFVNNAIHRYSDPFTIELTERNHSPRSGQFLVLDYLPSDYPAETLPTQLPLYSYRHFVSDDFRSTNRTWTIYRQTEVAWRQQPYAHSQSMTIGSHGCALTSAAMMLDYWGHNYIWSANLNTDPADLNTYLQQTPGGYLHQTYLNWQAISQLTQRNHQLVYGDNPIEKLPKLEFKPNQAQNPDQARAQILSDLDQGWSSIINIGGQFGHFLLAASHDDYLLPAGEIKVADPYYSGYITLDEIEQNGPHFLLGNRSFKPSYSDLSYWLIYSFNPALQIQVQSTDQAIATLPFFTDQIGDPTQQQSDLPPLYQYYFTQPESGEYQLVINNIGSESADLSFLFYDQAGEITYFQENHSDLAAYQTVYLDLSYFKSPLPQTETIPPTTLTVINPELNFPQLRADLLQAYQSGQILTPVYRQLDQLLAAADQRRGDEVLLKRLLHELVYRLEYFIAAPAAELYHRLFDQSENFDYYRRPIDNDFAQRLIDRIKTQV